jgi:hypothetical protein
MYEHIRERFVLNDKIGCTLNKLKSFNKTDHLGIVLNCVKLCTYVIDFVLYTCIIEMTPGNWWPASCRPCLDTHYDTV